MEIFFYQKHIHHHKNSLFLISFLFSIFKPITRKHQCNLDSLEHGCKIIWGSNYLEDQSFLKKTYIPRWFYQNKTSQSVSLFIAFKNKHCYFILLILVNYKGSLQSNGRIFPFLFSLNYSHNFFLHRKKWISLHFLRRKFQVHEQYFNFERRYF